MTKRKNVGYMALLLVLLATMVFVSCDQGEAIGGQGSLKIILRDEINARTIAPELDMWPAFFRITCDRTGSSDRIGPVDVSGNWHMFNGILAGTWLVTVEAYNDDAEPVRIGEGQKQVTIVRGSSSVAKVTIVPLSGQGQFTFTLDWTGTCVDAPNIVAFLTPETALSEVQIDGADITISGSTATITVDELPMGYYDFSYVLKDGDSLFAGNYHEVRILSGQVSSAVEIIPVSAVGVWVSIIDNLHNPFEVEILSDDNMLERICVQPFHASPADGIAYQWYLDGMKIAGANEATYHVDGEGMAFGWHTLSVKVKKAEGWYSSGTTSFLMDEFATNRGFIELHLTNKAYSDDAWHLFMANGPAEDSVGFNMLGTYPSYYLPIHFETAFEQGHDNFVDGSFMLASSVPLDISAGLSMFPYGGDEQDECMVTGLGAWEVDYHTVELDTPYPGCLFMAFSVDGEGRRKTFDSINNLYNPLDEDGHPRWGGLDYSDESSVFITFTKYGELEGSYVKGAISGTAVSVIPDQGIEPEKLGYYEIEGQFVVPRGTSSGVIHQ
ncbi:MAG: hypothetical protein RBR15_15350 [Sphaerochaeta sp.]|nr:hypothetical protein [Sphaerochaeta sp.]